MRTSAWTKSAWPRLPSSRRGGDVRALMPPSLSAARRGLCAGRHRSETARGTRTLRAIPTRWHPAPLRKEPARPAKRPGRSRGEWGPEAIGREARLPATEARPPPARRTQAELRATTDGPVMGRPGELPQGRRQLPGRQTTAAPCETVAAARKGPSGRARAEPGTDAGCPASAGRSDTCA